MAEFCGSLFWDPRLTWDSPNPRFTPCFEATALSWFPLLFLMTLGIVDLFNVTKPTYTRKQFRSTFTILTTAKTLLSIILILIYTSQLVRLRLAWGYSNLFVVDWMSPALLIFGHVIALLLCFYTKFRGVHASACQFFFWAATCLTQGFLFSTALKQFGFYEKGTKEDIINLSRLITFPIISIRFILELISDSSDHVPLSKNNPSPDKTSSFFSKLFFLWYDSMAWTGYRRTLTTDDLWELNPQDRSHVQSELFMKYWEQEVAKTKKLETGGEAGILIPLCKCFGITFAFGLLLRVASDLLVFVQPFIICALIAHLTTDVEPPWKGYFYVGIIGLTSCFQSIISASSSKRSYLTAMRVKSTLSNAVFRKTLLISSASRKESSLGSIVNLQAVDAQKLSDFLPTLNFSFGSPFLIIISSVLLYTTLGPSILVGVGILVLIIPLSLSAVALARRYQEFQMVLKDEQIKLTSELITGIKVLKLYAWELSYQKRIEDIRNKELGYLRKIAALNTFTVSMNHASPVIVPLATFATYVLTDPSNILNSEKAFVAINLLNIVKNAMILLPMVCRTGIQAFVSVQRLNKYLNMEEMRKEAVTHDESFRDPIVIRNANLSWDGETTSLKNINFSVKTGELVAIVGRIGSGKSSLLSALLGDLTRVNGVINLKGTVSYVSQTAWIQNATLKDNILFQDPLIQNRYKMVVNSCALRPDLEQLPFGDETEIGENGVNLSGGQKQRVAVARAAYKDASVYLFDDPLAAVDAHVGKHIFENLIGPNGILRNKTRVLVTHGVSFLPYMNRIFVMKDGEISESGTYRELLATQGEFANFLQEHSGMEDSSENVDSSELSLRQDFPELIPIDRSARLESVCSDRSQTAALRVETSISPTGTAKLIQKETTAVGNIKFSIFTGYFKAAGFWLSISALLFSIFSSGFIGYSNVWLSQWVTESTLEELITGRASKHTTDKYLAVYGIIAVLQGVLAFAGTWTIALVCLAAAKNLQSKALARVIQAPMSYFDTTLMGRLINKFSKDVDTLDNLVPLNLRSFTLVFFNVLTTFVVISYVSPQFIVFMILLAIFYTCLQRFYVATSRQLKRLDGITRSPIYSHFSETVSGSSVIRAFRLEQKFITDSETKVDMNQMAFFPLAVSNMWIGVRLELIGALIIISTCIFMLLSRGSITPGSAGLSISYAFQVTLMLNLLARQMSDLETNIVSAERLEELTHIPQEAPWSIPNTTPPPSWPENGELKMDNFETKYREGLPLVLKGISCTIASGEKVGVVGRTGAGKSSFTLALFRLIESTGGTISIDGLDISSLGLHDLRKKITIIPQDPVIFSGSLRLNLDPFDQYSDVEVWRCLDLAHLKPYVCTLKGNLGYKLEEEGKNLSVGQRQLICLARALLRKTKILILDEATAAVDLETDDLIQATIRKEFKEATVITIAHRLNTILDSDRVLVLHNGEIKEFDSPASLLQNPTTVFSGMARDAKII